MLLGGYIYAHLVSKYLFLKAQICVHAAVTALVIFFLPLAVSANVVLPESGMPTFWLLGLFRATVGLPFFALSANAPLLQRWFSLNDHKDSQNPYGDMGARSTGVLMGSEAAMLWATSGDPSYQSSTPSRHVKVWTDDYSSILGTLVAHSLQDGKAEAIPMP